MDHTECDCRRCAYDMCETRLTTNTALNLGGIYGDGVVMVHKKCLIPYLLENGEAMLIDKEGNER